MFVKSSLAPSVAGQFKEALNLAACTKQFHGAAEAAAIPRLTGKCMRNFLGQGQLKQSDVLISLAVMTLECFVCYELLNQFGRLLAGHFCLCGLGRLWWSDSMLYVDLVLDLDINGVGLIGASTLTTKTAMTMVEPTTVCPDSHCK